MMRSFRLPLEAADASRRMTSADVTAFARLSIASADEESSAPFALGTQDWKL